MNFSIIINITDQIENVQKEIEAFQMDIDVEEYVRDDFKRQKDHYNSELLRLQSQYSAICSDQLDSVSQKSMLTKMELVEQKLGKAAEDVSTSDRKYENLLKGQNSKKQQFLRLTTSKEKLLSLETEFDTVVANLVKTEGLESMGISRIQCPSCTEGLCGQCGRKWDNKHAVHSCEDSELRRLKDDLNLGNVLNDFGIECPNCHMWYIRADGGCLHFDCMSCGKTFCGSCFMLFGQKCGVPNCPMTDFHAHHSRNCLYYLRDYDVVFLEGMLQGQDYTQLGGTPEKKCSFKITDNKLKDMDCGQAVTKSTGFCELHYKEYLITFITKLGIDPADFAKTSNELNLMLYQAKLPRLEKIGKETEPQFMARIKQHVKTNCKLYVPRGAVGVVGGGD